MVNLVSSSELIENCDSHFVGINVVFSYCQLLKAHVDLPWLCNRHFLRHFAVSGIPYITAVYICRITPLFLSLPVHKRKFAVMCLQGVAVCLCALGVAKDYATALNASSAWGCECSGWCQFPGVGYSVCV